MSRRAAVVTALSALLLAAFGAGAASATPLTGTDESGTYLALGDSVAFGYVPSGAVPAPNYRKAKSFVGYPEILAWLLDKKVSNASCAGETTASMLIPGAQSNGCENSVGSPVGYRTLYPLHEQYSGTQMEYALRFLSAHKHTNLITIDIGANDAFVCAATTADGCTSAAELGALANQIGQNLAAIYTQLRVVAGYTGPIVALTYYSLNYADPGSVGLSSFLNSVISNVTLQFGGRVADGFAAFAGPSAVFGGSPCAAGLLIKLPNGTCDIHPSPVGHLLLAAAIAHVVRH